jgi:uncharacterized membrane protein
MHLAWVIGLFFMLAVLAGVAILVAWAVSSRPASATASPSMPGTPLEILDRRFAAGEIGADEYKRARDLLGGGGAKP